MIRIENVTKVYGKTVAVKTFPSTSGLVRFSGFGS